MGRKEGRGPVQKQQQMVKFNFISRPKYRWGMSSYSTHPTSNIISLLQCGNFAKQPGEETNYTEAAESYHQNVSGELFRDDEMRC